jgi:hypothetical protein
LISVRSEVQILPGPPPAFAQQNAGPRQRLRLQPRERRVSAEPKSRGRDSRALARRERHRAEKGSWFRCALLRLSRRKGAAGAASDFGLRPKPRGCSSVGRAPALQAGGRRFDSDHLHHCANDAKHRLSRSAAAALLRRESTGHRESGRCAAGEGRLIDRGKQFAQGRELMGV